MTDNKYNHTNEVNAGDRFEFGKNWIKYLDNFDNARLDDAQDSLKDMLHIDRLDGKTFLDVGSGSAIFSLAAKSLGASVVSIDYDPDCIECAINSLRAELYCTACEARASCSWGVCQ